MNWKLLKSINDQETNLARPKILNAFWNNRIVAQNPHSINLIRGFLKGRPPAQWHSSFVTRDEWSSIVNNEFELLLREQDKNRFFKLFEHISDVEILDIDKGEQFGITRQKIEITKQLSDQDENDIKEYMADMGMSAAVSIFSEGKTTNLSTDGNNEKSIFSIHSVGKIFTGLMILILIEKGIINEADLNNPIQISEKAKSKLPASILERLETVSLHDLMTHKGGLGDFMGNYVADIRNALENQTELPNIENIEDFLSYANDDLSEPGKVHYSNLGTLLVGLAAEHAYSVYQKTHAEYPPLSFNEMLFEFIQKPAGMAVLSDRMPENAKVNTRTDIVEPTPEAGFLVANPSGGYWTSVNDLHQFGMWIYNKAQQPDFAHLISNYGQEFHLDEHTIGHKGENPSASAMLTISLKSGRIIATLSNSSRTTAHILEESIREYIFSDYKFKSIDTKLTENNIPGASIATIEPESLISKQSYGVTNQDTPLPITDSTIFEAASLSKPVFAYMVLKSIEKGLFSRPGESPESGLDTPLNELYELYDPGSGFGPPHLRSHPNYMLLTPRLLLSHQAALPNWFSSGSENYLTDDKTKLDVKAGTRFDYSGMGYCFLCEALEMVCGKPFNDIAQEFFDEQHLQMPHSSFVPHAEGTQERENRARGHDSNGSLDRTEHYPREQRPNPAASLFTTAEDYAKFLIAIANDPFIRTHQFQNPVNMAVNDHKAISAGVSTDVLSHLQWGLGMGLQKNDNDEAIAFHWGDCESFRTFAAINLQTGKGSVCLTNSANGPAIFRAIAEPVVGDLTPVCQWLSQREKLNVDITPPNDATSRFREELNGLRAGTSGSSLDHQNPDNTASPNI